MTRIRLMKFLVENQPAPKPGSEPTADMRGITTPRYFEALGLPIVQGRNFTQDEILQHASVIIMNQTLAQKLWPKEDPIGKHIRSAATKPGTEPVWLTVIGIARDIKQISLEEGTRPEIIRPMVDYTRLTLEVRSTGDPGALTSSIRSQIAALDRDLPLFDVSTMQDIVDSSLAERRFKSLLISFFAGAALLLAAVGLYGVLVSLVAQRTPEIGIRMALGAQRSNVLKLVFAQGLKLVLAGVLIGLVGGIALNYFLSSMLFAVKITNVLPYIAVSVLMLATGVCAIYVPARRAVKVDPLQAIRYE